MLKKILIVLLVLAICGGIVAIFHNIRVALRNKKELSAFAKEIPYNAKLGKVLVVYYSWTGHTEDVANQIAKLTNADIYRIQTEEEFKSSLSFYSRVKKDLKNKTYPALKGQMPNADDYDTIFVGSPVWWYTMATPMYAFLAQTDFKGKKVIPFSTQGSNPGTFLQDFNANAQNAKIGTYANFNNVSAKYNEAVHNKIVYWLNNL